MKSKHIPVSCFSCLFVAISVRVFQSFLERSFRRLLENRGGLPGETPPALGLVNRPLARTLAGMVNGKRVIVVMPAYNAEGTLVRTWEEVRMHGIVDHVVVVDDASRDATVEVARTLPDTSVIVHPRNRGYGGNQKTCYAEALRLGADIVVMVHPDYQYTPKLLPAMISLIAQDLYPCVLGSRILGGYARSGGMPWWRYVSNRALTAFSNLVLGSKLSELHTGYRAFSADLLRRLPLEANSDDFVFDQQMLAQILWVRSQIGEVSCPTKYFPEASSINFRRSVIYGFGCLGVALRFRLARWGLGKPAWLK